MKMHLPHGLRAALMAAIASVSLTTAYGAEEDWGLKDWKAAPTSATDVSIPVSANYGGYDATGTGALDLTFSRGTNFKNSNVTWLGVLNKNYKGDIYASVASGLLGYRSNEYYLRGLGESEKLEGNLYIRVYGDYIDNTPAGHIYATAAGSTVTGNVYLGLGEQWKHSGRVTAAANSTVNGKTELEIASGTFSGNMSVGRCDTYTGASSTSTTLNGGTNLKIYGGAFENNYVVAGCITDPTKGNSTIKSGTNLTITGGTFTGSTIVAGNTGAGSITGGTHTAITSGTFNNTTVYGGSTGARSTINDGVALTLSGGTFGTNSSVYALGNGGTVNGAVSLTIGNNAVFKGNTIISAGTNGSVNYSGVTSSKVTLSYLDSNSSLLKDETIKVMGGQQKTTLDMQKVKGTFNAQLSQFSAMEVTYESDLTLTQATNEALGGVSSVEIRNGSTLSLQNDAGKTWDLSRVALTNVGTLKKTGAGKLTIGDTSAFTGTINVQSGGLTLSGATAAKTLTVANGATLSVKEGNLFAGTGAGSTISIENGATLAANEGNWTLNKAATIDGVTISGSHAVALGSEVDNAAVVTLSGNINATNGNLILKNTAIAADKTATLSGNITFEGAVDNKGTLSIADGSTINVDEESLIRNGHFVHNGDKTAKNGFFADSEISLTTGNNFSVNKGNVTLSLDGVASDKLGLSTDGDTLSISGFADLVKGTYFVNEGNVSYTEIKTADDQKLTAIAVGNNGKGDTHQLTLDTALAEDVTIVSASDNAKVSVNEGVVLNASQTAIKGEANEVHVTGAGAVLLDDAAKFSQLAGDATMKVTKNTTVNSEAKMTGELNVESGDLTVTDEGTIASFSSVNLADNTTLAIETTHNDAIQSLSGSGKLVKTGEETTLTVQDASGFTGDISVSDKALVNLLGVGEGVNVSLHELVIDNGTLGVYVGDTSDAGEGEANVGALTLTGGSRIVVGGNGGTLEANLTTERDSILDFTSGGVLTMGCDLTVGEGTIVLLNESAYATLAEGGSVELFSGVDNKAMEASKVSVYLNTVGSADKMLAQVSFSSENGSVSVSVPEPATATLSLLALAGLAARRRRSKAVAA